MCSDEDTAQSFSPEADCIRLSDLLDEFEEAWRKGDEELLYLLDHHVCPGSGHYEQTAKEVRQRLGHLYDRVFFCIERLLPLLDPQLRRDLLRFLDGWNFNDYGAIRRMWKAKDSERASYLLLLVNAAVEATAMKRTNGHSYTKKTAADNNGEIEQPPALKKTEQLTLKALATFDPSTLASAEMVADAMPVSERRSPRTIGPAIKRLIALDLAERPEGDKQGTRLTIKGRRHASKIAE